MPLLTALLAQRTDGFTIDRILVVSDGSTDRTAEFVRLLADPRIELVEHAVRQGLGKTQNDIIARATGDTLVIVNADVIPADDRFLTELVRPLMTDPLSAARQMPIGLVGADVESAVSKRLIEAAVGMSHEFKQRMYETLHDSDTVYLCHGRARAFARAVYEALRWPDDVPEDAYSYFWAKQHGFGFAYAKDARVMFRSPATLADHARQSQRFVDGKRKLTAYFDPKTVAAAYRIPLGALILFFFRYTFRHPVLMASYLAVLVAARLLPLNGPLNHHHWEVSRSTKTIMDSQY